MADIPDNVKKGLQIIPVESVDQVLKVALTKPVTPIEWIEPADIEPAAAAESEDERGIVTH